MILIVIGVPFLLGLFVLALIMQKQAASYSLWEKLALSFSIGLGLLTVLMYLLASIKVVLSLPAILVAVALIIAPICLYLFFAKTFCLTISEIRSAFNFRDLKLTWPEIILIGLIGLKVVHAFFTALVKPMVDIDAFQFYSIVAKGIFYTGRLFDPYLSQFMSDKPPFPFIAQGWAFIGLGTANDALFKVITPVMFLCLLVIFYSALKRYYTRWVCLLFTFLLSSLPLMLYHVGTAYADFPITFYFSVGTIYLYLFIKGRAGDGPGRANTDLFAAALLLGITVWVKRAGLVLVGADLLALAVYLAIANKTISRKDWGRICLAILIFALIILPWISQGQLGTFTRILGSLSGSKVETALPAAAAAAAMPTGEKAGTMIAIFTKKLFLYGDWQLTWTLFVCSLIFFYQRAFRRPLNYLLAMITLSVMTIFIQFGSGEMFRWLLDGTLFDRLIMNEVPIVILFCAEAVIPGLTASFSANESRVSIKNKRGS